MSSKKVSFEPNSVIVSRSFLTQKTRVHLKFESFFKYIITFIKGFPTAIGKMPKKYLQLWVELFNEPNHAVQRKLPL